MRHFVLFFAAVLILFSGMVHAWAEEASSQPQDSFQEALDEYLEQGDGEELVQQVPPSAREVAPETGESIRDTLDSFRPQVLLARCTALIRQYISAPAQALLVLTGVLILCSVLDAMGSSLSQGEQGAVMKILLCVFVAAFITGPVVDCILDVVNALHDFSLFITTFIPILAGVMTAGGQPLTGAVYNILLFGACQLMASFVSAFLAPLLCAYLALSVTSVTCPGFHLEDAAAGLRSFGVWAMTLFLTVFTGLLTIQGVVASGGDQATIKTAKFMIGSLIPGIGGALSDLYVAAQGYLQIAKGTLGAFGVAVTVLTFLPLLLRILLWYLSLNLAALMSGILGSGSISSLLRQLSGALGLLLAVLCCQLLLVVISTTMVMIAFQTP
ncbi:stage III sporulation protein AE [Angelakisella massiliensis]|uniref:stage III sporulation protein AE n=1 Tax=Angelakisella massiliensis TaxID=1871018 RepID=UPI0023A82DED|nr:hypothetical protein [Angelakisella massiliensis]